MKKRVLCVCSKGLNRSKYLASYLRNKGYSARFGGVEYGMEKSKLINQKDIEWAEIIIVVRKRLERILKNKYKTKGKRIIVIDVTDSKRLIPKEYAHLKDLDYEEFQKKWTRPQIRKVLKKYLPL